jgi:hypothetical protein
MLVHKGDERYIEYHASSPFTFAEHPMRPKAPANAEGDPSQVPDKVKITAPEVN